MHIWKLKNTGRKKNSLTVSQAFKHKSKVTSDKMSNIHEDEFCFWNKSKLNILNKHQTYHKKMVNYIEKLKNEGQSDSIPIKPTSKLPIPSKKSSKLMGEKLHEYLEKKFL